jgi:uncharacterized protein (DUF58 family)
MLYPDFDDLVALKERKLNIKQFAARHANSTVQGNHHSPFRGRGLDFDSVRKYVPGDDIRSIDWRVTARMGSPHLKLFKEDRERNVLICLDMNGEMRFGTKVTFKSVLAAKIAAVLGWRALGEQDRVGACLFGDVPGGVQYFAASRTHKAFCTLLKAACTPMSEENSVPLDRALQKIAERVQTGSLVYIISDFMNLEKDFVQLNRIRQRCDVVFISVNDQADKNLFPMGALECVSKGEKLLVNTASGSGREAFSAQWKNNREHLSEIATKLRIPVIELTTESDIHKDLVMGLKSISKRKR